MKHISLKSKKNKFSKLLIKILIISILILLIITPSLIISGYEYQGKNLFFGALPVEIVKSPELTLHNIINTNIDNEINSLSHSNLLSSVLLNTKDSVIKGSIKSSDYLYEFNITLEQGDNKLLAHFNLNVSLFGNSSSIEFKNIKVDVMLDQSYIYIKVISFPDQIYSYINTFLNTTDIKSKYEGQWIRLDLASLKNKYGVDLSRYIVMFIPFIASSQRTTQFLADFENSNFFENTQIYGREFIEGRQYIHIQTKINTNALSSFTLHELQKDDKSLLNDSFLSSIMNFVSKFKLSFIDYIVDPQNYTFKTQTYELYTNDLSFKITLSQNETKYIEGLTLPSKSIDILDVINSLNSPSLS